MQFELYEYMPLLNSRLNIGCNKAQKSKQKTLENIKNQHY